MPHMPETHPGTDIEIPNAVPTSGFRCAIKNTKRYMKHNSQTLEAVARAAHEGDHDKLEELLSSGDEMNLFNGDLNEHYEHVTPLMLAAITGQTECVELLLQAKADPHMKERMAYGKDPADGRTALAFADESGWEDVVEILRQAENEHPYGWYVPEGVDNNKKVYCNFEWDKKPVKGWYSSRPGVAERNGFDPNKYGTGAYRQPPEAFPTPIPAPPPGGGLADARKPTAASAAESTSQASQNQQTIPVALLFPGQGSQYIGMLSSCKDLPAVKSMLAKADDILGYSILDLCLQGPEAKLEETRFCQPAMFLAGLAGVEKLREERAEVVSQFAATAGLSLGEYTALCAAGVFSMEDGLRLVQLRGEAMQEAAGMSKQAMVSIAGFDKPKLLELCAQAAKAEGGSAVCQVANELFPKGYACAGTESAVLTLQKLAVDAGALQSRLLKTSGGFHTSLMAPAKEKLGKALDDLLPKMQPPRHTIYMNVNSQPLAPGTDPKVIVDLLKQQMIGGVLWEPTMRAMLKAGIKDFYEVGPQKQLKAMMKRISPEAWSNTTAMEV